MSRIGKKPVAIPKGTEVSVSGGLLKVKGPLGELVRPIRSEGLLSVEGDKAKLSIAKENILTRALWGTFASHLKNMISGVNKLYEKKLIVEGIGFKAEVKGSDLVLSLGFSHPVKVSPPKDIKVTSEKGAITISGIDKEKVGQWAAYIRGLKKPEPYKGKGIRYEGEVIKRKQGKKTA